MEKVDLYVRKILALAFSAAIFFLFVNFVFPFQPFWVIFSAALGLLTFSYLDFRITGDKPRFLFGLNQSDTFLNKKGGFWNLFKWIVTTLGFAYDMLVWVAWGIFLIFMLGVDLIMLLKFILFWIIRAIIWFIRQFFPPVVFTAKMIYHYLIKWVWWIYKLTFRNIRISVNKNFYFIALWGTIPAMFIVFLFIAISQWTGIPQLVLISVIFAIIPLVWSFGEISALRYENREKDDYGSVTARFSNGFDAVRSVLLYLVIAVVLVAAEILLNLLGWIPNISMTLLGITLNLNMAFSLVLIFVTIILVFADMIIPPHILYRPEHGNDLDSSLQLLGVIARRFLRYLTAHLPATIFGSFLMFLPALVVFMASVLTDNAKDAVLQSRIGTLQEKVIALDGTEQEKYQVRMDRLRMYQEIPVSAAEFFRRHNGSRDRLDSWDQRIDAHKGAMERENIQFNERMEELNAAISMAETSQPEPTSPDEVLRLSDERLTLEEEHLARIAEMKEELAVLEMDRKEEKRVRIQMPILYLFVGIFFAIFGGLVVAVMVSYLGNVYFELYDFREDGKPTYWRQTATEINEKDPNQPLLGFTFIAIIGLLLIAVFRWGLFGIV